MEVTIKNSKSEICSLKADYHPSRHIVRIVDFVSKKGVDKEVVEEVFDFLKEIEFQGCDVVLKNDLMHSNYFALNKEDDFGQIFISTKDWNGDVSAHKLIFILLHEWGHFEQFRKKQKFLTRLKNEKDAWIFADGVISSSKYLKKYQSEYENFKKYCLDHYRENTAIDIAKAIESIIIAIPTAIILYFAAIGFGFEGEYALPVVLSIAIIRGYSYYQLSFGKSWIIRAIMFPLYSLNIVPKPGPSYLKTKNRNPDFSK